MAKKKKKTGKKTLKVGRPTKFSYPLAVEICQRLSEGEPLTKICKTSEQILREAKAKGVENPILPIHEMPAYSTVMKWLFETDEKGNKKYPKFIDMYERARDIQADYMAEYIIDIADEDPIIYDASGEPVTCYGNAVKRSPTEQKNRIDARKWVAAKLKPRKYSDKIRIESNDSPAKDEDLTPSELKERIEKRIKQRNELLARKK